MKGKLYKNHNKWWSLWDMENNCIANTINVDGFPFKLSIKNCQAIELGYDLDELVEDNFKGLRDCISDSDIAEFYISLVKTTVTELLGDKKFSERDVKIAYNRGSYDDRLNNKKLFSDDKYIQSLQQTEWDVDIVMEINLNGKNGLDRAKMIPKIDADGCLILKKI